MNILLLSGYDAGSHQRWHEGLTASSSNHTWTVLCLPARRFSWRYVGNAYSWFARELDTLQKEYDLLICTSMVNLGMLKGLVPSLADIETVVYFHENQFVYPIQHAVVQREMFHLSMQSIYTSLCADKILFNSQYNKESFLDGARNLLKRMPDFAPRTPILNIEHISAVLPVPIEDEVFCTPTKRMPIQCPHIVWNHRWEYDKAPERLFAALDLLKKEQVPFSISVVGQQFNNVPECFEENRLKFEPEIVHWGYLESKEAYYQLLEQADIVVSTAVHEFQGLALLEGIAKGCIPIAPNRLAYPEYVPQEQLYESHEDVYLEARGMADKIIQTCLTPTNTNIEAYRSSVVWPKYHDILGL